MKKLEAKNIAKDELLSGLQVAYTQYTERRLSELRSENEDTFGCLPYAEICDTLLEMLDEDPVVIEMRRQMNRIANFLGYNDFENYSC